MTYARRWFLLWAVTALLVACSQEVGRPTDWKSLDLPEKRLDLQDSGRVETYVFSAQGHVAATFGTKGGALTAPLLFWRIDGADLILSEEPGPDGKLFTTFREPSIKGDIVTMKRADGGTARFQLSKR
jgi:hypothetical protein